MNSTTTASADLAMTGASQVSVTDVNTSSTPILEVWDTIFVTVFVVLCFVVCKSSYDRIRQWRVRLNVVIVGSGPIGLTAAIISACNKRVDKIVLYEEKNRAQLFARPQQIALDARSITFLQKLNVDFDNIEGCWQHDQFYTRIGILQEYLLGTLERLQADVTIKLGTKVGLASTKTNKRATYIFIQVYEASFEILLTYTTHCDCSAHSNLTSARFLDSRICSDLCTVKRRRPWSKPSAVLLYGLWTLYCSLMDASRCRFRIFDFEPESSHCLTIQLYGKSTVVLLTVYK